MTDIALFIANLAVDVWLLAILTRRGVSKQLPWFVFYIRWEFLAVCVGLATWLVSHHLYITVFWWMEGVRVALVVGAVRESLLRIFAGFESLLRWSVFAAIGAVVAYSAWKAVHAPPVQSSRLVSFLIGAEFTFRWGVAGVAILSIALMWFVSEPVGSREDAVITGSGIASLAVVATVVSRSLFGTQFTFFTQYLPDMGYFVAVFLWIRIFARPTKEFGFKELGMGPEDIASELRRYRELAEQIVRKLW